MKKLEKAMEDFKKAKDRYEALKERTAQAERRMRECEADKIEAENMEYAMIIREMQMSIPELRELQRKMKKEPIAVPEELKEETHDEFKQNESR